MKLITSLLERYKNLAAPDAEVKREVCAIVREWFGVQVAEACVSVNRGAVFVRMGSSVKSELVLREQEFLLEIKRRTGKVFASIC